MLHLVHEALLDDEMNCFPNARSLDFDPVACVCNDQRDSEGATGRKDPSRSL